MWWSWSVIKSPTILSEDTHIGIQDDLKRVITSYLEDNIPSIKNIHFEKFWTQTLKENKVRATFSYTFDEEVDSGDKSARIGVAGHAILNRQKEDGTEFDVWSLDELYVDNNSVNFKEGITIHPNEGDATPANGTSKNGTSESSAPKNETAHDNE
jgi:hypothetical protein